MSQFDPFRFLECRRNGLPLDEFDKSDFVPYVVVQAVSMDSRYRKDAHMLNDISFSHLPSDIQAMALLSLNNNNDIDTKWSRVKTGSTKDRDEFIDHVMKVYRISHHTAVSVIKYGLVDREKVDERYYRLFEPEKLIELYGSKPKKGRKK